MTQSPNDPIPTSGQRWDATAQLYYYGARFYDPRVANFISEDPAREYMNPYAYVSWNPVKFADPSGAYSELAAVTIQLMFERAGLGEIGRSLAEHYTAGSGGVAQGGGLTSANGGPGGSSGIEGILQTLGLTVLGNALSDPVLGPQILATLQGGGTMTAANPVLASPLNASVALNSSGIAFSANLAGGVGSAASAAGDLTGVMGYFSGSDERFSAGGYGEAVGGGAFVRVGPYSVGAPAGQANSTAVGASAGFGFGVFGTNATSQFQLGGNFVTVEINSQVYASVQVSFAGNIYVVAVFPSFAGLTRGFSITSLSTYTSPGSISGRYR